MRHIRTRRRFKLILTTLLTLCLIMFFESRVESFMPHLKDAMEARAEEMLGNRARLSIDNIGGGIIHPISFNDIKIKDKNDKPIFPSIVINRIKTNYRLWDVFIDKKDSSVIANLLSKDSSIDVNFTDRNKELSGFIRLEGDLINPSFIGSVTTAHIKRMDFSGSIKGDSFDLEIRPSKGILRVHGKVAENGDLTAYVNADHLRLKGFDITCEGILKNRIKVSAENPKARFLEGELQTQKVILNYRPFLNLKAAYKIENSRLEIPSLDFEDSFRVYGTALIKDPYTVNLTLAVNNVNIAWLLSSLKCEDVASVISGTMSGKFELKGPAKKLKLSVQMDIRNGTIAKLNFNSLSATLKGDLPFLRIEDSRITRDSGYFALAGELDLRKIGKGNLFDDIKLVTDDMAITWDEWNATKLQYDEAVTMTKKLNEDFSIDFKKIVQDGKIDESSRDSDNVQLEYKLHPNDSLKMVVGQDSNFLGLEHKDKF